MSKKISFLICSLFLLMVGQAAAADSMVIWKGAATPQGFAEFRARLENIGGVYPNGDLSAEKLALGACSMAVQQKLHDNLQQCQTDFRRLNRLLVSKFGEHADKVPYQQFAAVGDNVGWLLPLSAAATPVATAKPAPATAPSGASTAGLQAARQQAAAAATPVAGDVALLRGRADAADLGRKVLIEELAAVRRQLRGATKGGKATAAQIAALQKGEKELLAKIDAAQRGVDSKLDAVETKVAGVSGELGNLSNKVDHYAGQFEAVQSRFDQNRGLIYGLGAVILLVIGLLVIGGFKGRDINKRLTKTEGAVEDIEESILAVKERVIFVEEKENNAIRIAMGATETGQAALAKAEAVERELKEVRARANAAAVTAHQATLIAAEAVSVACNVRIVTDIDDSVLASLPVGGHLPVEIEIVDGEQKLTLMIERTAEGEVTIQGITRQAGSNTPVVTSLRRDKIVAAIYRAARAGRVVVNHTPFPGAVKAA